MIHDEAPLPQLLGKSFVMIFSSVPFSKRYVSVAILRYTECLHVHNFIVHMIWLNILGENLGIKWNPETICLGSISASPSSTFVLDTSQHLPPALLVHVTLIVSIQVVCLLTMGVCSALFFFVLPSISPSIHLLSMIHLFSLHVKWYYFPHRECSGNETGEKSGNNHH